MLRGMKSHKIISSILAVATVLLPMTGCQKENMSRGKAVSFHVTSGNHDTKAAYSGTVVDGYERIDWAVGDLIRIWCDQASYGKPGNPAVIANGNKFADYKVVEGITAKQKISEATIKKNDANNELLWGNENTDHYFYAVYPSPATSSPWVSAMNKNTITGTVKATQTGDGRFSDGMVMVAKTGPLRPGTFDKDAVFLEFSPITTAIKFSIKNGLSSAINVKKVELQSGSHALSGEFNYNIVGSAATDYSGSVTDEEKSVAIENSSPYVNLPASGGDPAYVFTFFLRPDDNLDDLSIVITDSNDVTYTSELKTSSGAYTFSKGSKTVITGIVVEKVLNLLNFASLGAGADIRTNGTVSEEILF